ncbi:MAG: PilN domain-containing protein [Gammaproteobacteria bacterium]
MNQQINLYQPIFRRQKKVFSAVTMLQICALFVVVFTGIYVYGEMKLQPLRTQLANLDRDLRQQNAEMAKLEGRQTGESGSRLLENEVTRLTNELARHQRVQTMLSSRAMGNTRGLSGYFEAFARQHVQGLWLTKITVTDGGRNLGLNGKTLSSELVPVYINRLTGEQLLNGTAFNVMELSRETGPVRQLDFYVSTN